LFKSLNPPLKLDKVKVWKRDLRESSLQPFGRWSTSFDWSDIFTTNACEDKYGKFNDIMSDTIDILLPLKKTKATKCDKPWLTSSIKELILKRQKALHYYGKNSDAYKFWRNQVQQSIKSARFKYYAQSVEKLKTWKFSPQNGGRKLSCWVVYLPKAVGIINYFLIMFLIAMTWLKNLTVSFPVLQHILLL
jgi:hypothetical protein